MELKIKNKRNLINYILYVEIILELEIKMRIEKFKKENPKSNLIPILELEEKNKIIKNIQKNKTLKSNIAINTK